MAVAPAATVLFVPWNNLCGGWIRIILISCFLHIWDRRTPPEELAFTLNDLVRSGKVRYLGMSNLPAWYIARLQTIAEWRGLEKLCAIQLEYSLVNRDLENEYTSLCLENGDELDRIRRRCRWLPYG